MYHYLFLPSSSPSFSSWCSHLCWEMLHSRVVLFISGVTKAKTKKINNIYVHWIIFFGCDSTPNWINIFQTSQALFLFAVNDVYPKWFWDVIYHGWTIQPFSAWHRTHVQAIEVEGFQGNRWKRACFVNTTNKALKKIVRSKAAGTKLSRRTTFLTVKMSHKFKKFLVFKRT